MGVLALLPVALAAAAVAAPLNLPGLGVTFERSPEDPPITPEIHPGDVATLGSFLAHETLFSVLRANVVDPGALPVTDPERQRNLLAATREGGLSVSESGITQLAGEPAFFTVGSSARGGRVSYQYSLTLMKEKRTFRFTLVSVVDDPRKNARAIRLLNSAQIL